MKPTVIHNTNSGNDINNYSDPNANNNPDIQPQLLQQQQQQQHPQQHPQQQQQPQGIYDNNGLAGGANSRRFPFYPTGFDFFDDDELFPEGGVRSRLNRMRDPFGTWGRKRRNSQEHVAPQQTAQGGTVPQTQQIPQPDEGYEDDFFPQMQPAWGTDTTWGRAPRKRNPNLDDDDDFFSYIPQQFRQYIPSNFQFPRMRSSFGRQQVPTQAAHSPQSRNYFPQQQQQQSPPQHQKSVQQEPLNRPKYCDAAMQTDADLLSQSNANGQGDQPNLNQHGLRNTIDMGQKANDEFDEAGPRARSAPPDPNYQNDPNNPNNFASAQSFSSAAGFPGQKPQVYAQATATPGAQAQAHAQAHTANMGTNTGPGTPNGGNIYRQYYYPFDNNAAQPNSPPRQQQQQTPPTQQTPNNDGQFVRTVPIVIESRKVPAKPKPQPQNQPTPPQAQAPSQQQQPPLSSQPREIPIQVEHTKARNQAPPSPQAAQQPPPSPQAAEPEQPKTPAPHDSITKIQAIQKEVMELMLAVEQFKGNGRNKEYIYLDEMLTRNLIKLDDIETDGKENIRLARKEAIKCIQASLCVLEMKADGRIPAIDSKPDESQSIDDEPKIDATAQETQSPEDSANATNDQEKTENATHKNDDDRTESKTDDTQAPSTPSPQANETNAVDSKENESENKNETSSKEVEPKSPVADETTPATVETAAPAADVKSAAEST